jgi:hypothetical protein
MATSTFLSRGLKEFVLSSRTCTTPPSCRPIISQHVPPSDTFNPSIDDIEDNSPLRRGSSAAHVKYGIGATINAGNLMYFRVMTNMVNLGAVYGADKMRLMKVFVQEMVEGHLGQGIEIWWNQNRVCPTFEEYALMVERSDYLISLEDSDNLMIFLYHLNLRDRGSPSPWNPPSPLSSQRSSRSRFGWP